MANVYNSINERELRLAVWANLALLNYFDLLYLDRHQYKTAMKIHRLHKFKYAIMHTIMQQISLFLHHELARKRHNKT